VRAQLGKRCALAKALDNLPSLGQEFEMLRSRPFLRCVVEKGREKHRDDMIRLDLPESPNVVGLRTAGLRVLLRVDLDPDRIDDELRERPVGKPKDVPAAFSVAVRLDTATIVAVGEDLAVALVGSGSVTPKPSPIETIHIRLLGEGIDVWRPTEGRKVGPMTFEVLPTPNYDDANEDWEFPPGMVVVARYQRHGDEVLLEAWHRAPTLVRDETTDLVDALAQRLRIKVRPVGGLRLIASQDAQALVAGCVANRLLITYAEVFQLLDEDPVSLEWGGADEFVRPGTGLQRPRQVEGFVARTAAQGRWFDFVVHRSDGSPVSPRRASLHVAPLPRTDAGLRLVEDAVAVEVRRALEPRGYESFVHMAEIANGGTALAAERALRDLSVLAFGESLPPYARVKRPERVWQRLTPLQRALRFLTRAASEDLAYGGDLIEPKVAAEVAETWVRHFGPTADCFTNGIVRDDDSFSGWDPLTTATFERGLGVVGAGRVGLLIVTGED
jgi:hypothetical protein